MHLIIQLGECGAPICLTQLGLFVSEDIARRLASNEPLTILRALLEVTETLLVKAETNIEQLPNGMYTVGEEQGE